MNEEKILKLKGKTLVCIDWANVYGWFKTLKWEINPRKLFDYLKGYPEVYKQNFYYGKEVGNIKSEEFQNSIEIIGFNTRTKEVKWVPVSLEKSHFKEIIKDLFNVLDKIKSSNSELSIKLYDLIQRIEKMADNSYVETVSGEMGYAFFDEQQLKEVFDLISGLDTELKQLNIEINELQKRLKEPIKRRKCDFDCELVIDINKEKSNFDCLVLFSGDGDYAAIVDELIKMKKQVIVVFAPGHKGKEYEDFKEGLFLCSVNRLKGFLV
jgi:uncharacterized LabA/DUF88 family protein